MRICIIARSLSQDYSGSFEFDQATALAGIGHEVSLISLDLRSVLRKRKLGVSRTTDKGIEIIRISVPLGAINKRCFYGITVPVFKKVLKQIIKKEGDFDVIHAHFLDNAYITARTLDKVDTKAVFVVTEHSNVTSIKAYEDDGYMEEIIRYSYSRPDRLIAVSDELAKIIMECYGAESTVVCNLVDVDLFSKSINVQKAASPTVLVSVGNLTENKRMDLLIKSFVKAFGDDENYRLCICGGGEKIGDLRKLIKKLGCSDRVELPGIMSREEISRIFERAGFFVLLSLKETFGVAFVEAMASGLPVISTKSGGPEEFITESVGLLVDDDEDTIAQTMRNMADNLSKYDPKIISQYATDNFSPDVVAEKITAVYRQAIQQRSL